MRITDRLSRMETAVNARLEAAEWERTQAEVDAMIQEIMEKSRRRMALGLPPPMSEATRRLLDEIKASVERRV